MPLATSLRPLCGYVNLNVGKVLKLLAQLLTDSLVKVTRPKVDFL